MNKEKRRRINKNRENPFPMLRLRLWCHVCMLPLMSKLIDKSLQPHHHPCGMATWEKKNKENILCTTLWPFRYIGVSSFMRSGFFALAGVFLLWAWTTVVVVHSGIALAKSLLLKTELYHWAQKLRMSFKLIEGVFMVFVPKIWKLRLYVVSLRRNCVVYDSQYGEGKKISDWYSDFLGDNPRRVCLCR